MAPLSRKQCFFSVFHNVNTFFIALGLLCFADDPVRFLLVWVGGGSDLVMTTDDRREGGLEK